MHVNTDMIYIVYMSPSFWSPYPERYNIEQDENPPQALVTFPLAGFNMGEATRNFVEPLIPWLKRKGYCLMIPFLP